MKLWLDDERPCPAGWTLAKTAQEAIKLLQTGLVVEISLDHDLGPSEAGSGYDVATFIEENAALARLPSLVRWSVHSANPVGRRRIIQAMESADRQWARLGL